MTHHHTTTSLTHLGSKLGHALSGLPSQLAHIHSVRGALALPAVHSVLSLAAVAGLALMLAGAALSLLRGRLVMAALSAVFGLAVFAALRSPVAIYGDVRSISGKVSRVHDLASAAATFPVISQALVVVGAIVVCIGLFQALKSLLKAHPVSAVAQGFACGCLAIVVSSATNIESAYHFIAALA